MNLDMPMKQQTKPRAIAVQSPVPTRLLVDRRHLSGAQHLPFTSRSPEATPHISSQLTANSGITFFIAGNPFRPKRAGPHPGLCGPVEDLVGPNY
jgi:hypothetical protein